MRLTGKKRVSPTKDEKLAAALLQLKRIDENGELVPLVDREWAKDKTPSQIAHEFDFDHWPVAVSLGGTNHPTNLVPKLRADHKKKTAEKDAKINAKLRRILAKEQERAAKMTAFFLAAYHKESAPEQTTRAVEKKKKWPSKPIPGSKSSGFKKPMRGNAVKREKVK